MCPVQTVTHVSGRSLSISLRRKADGTSQPAANIFILPAPRSARDDAAEDLLLRDPPA
jgi:hypothetical protein